MKRKLFILPVIVSIALLLIGADFRTAEPQAVAEIKKHCAGYTIIEAGLGVDCAGDTVKLIKKYGYYELAATYSSDALVAGAN